MVFLSTSEIKGYVQSRKFKNYIPDWIAACILFAYFFLIAEHAQPFNRQFSPSDLSIQHPYAVEERVSGMQCIALATLVPSFVITAVTVSKVYLRSKSKEDALHTLQVAILGLAIAISVTGTVTDILKNWIAQPRPDFLARCGIKPELNSDKLLDISSCSAPLGANVLLDGLRSTPSGHSSISFVAFAYLTLWILAQYRLISNCPKSVYKYILAALPLLLATYIALSRTQDYRHHFFDIIFGSLIGCIFAWLVFRLYWENLTSEECEMPRSRLEQAENDTILPL
ncbi:hypothetical protein PVL30_000531 [Lodderomyces elongisporus]|uniref:uncharacterized protein n=1 Tax=Lodderomyces elongisporus TaxID=36914 RepID=UPI0029218D90|nr:uncharacterized protein PVL30_000531 [Lodderomyces elongisporus]WLF76827.1 hypothetical protein PVL30_000531 [Lodderomyces elongisporus]